MSISFEFGYCKRCDFHQLQNEQGESLNNFVMKSGKDYNSLVEITSCYLSELVEAIQRIQGESLPEMTAKDVEFDYASRKITAGVISSQFVHECSAQNI